MRLRPRYSALRTWFAATALLGAVAACGVRLIVASVHSVDVLLGTITISFALTLYYALFAD